MAYHPTITHGSTLHTREAFSPTNGNCFWIRSKRNEVVLMLWWAAFPLPLIRFWRGFQSGLLLSYDPIPKPSKICILTKRSWIRLIYNSSVAFLAVPNLVDISQCHIIISMGLSLSCVVVGLNAKVGEKLSEVEQISLQSTTWITISLSLYPKQSANGSTVLQLTRTAGSIGRNGTRDGVYHDVFALHPVFFLIVVRIYSVVHL